MCLNLWSSRENANLALIKLPSDIVDYMRASIFLETPTFDNFIVQSLREKIRRDEIGFSVPALEDAIQRALLVLDAMKNKLLVTFEEQMSSRSPAYNAQLTTTICAYHAATLTVATDLAAQFQLGCAFVQAKGCA